MTRAIFIIPSLRRGGAETQLIDLTASLPTGQFAAEILVAGGQTDQADRVPDHIPIHHCARKYKFDLAPARALRKLIDNTGADVVHCTLQFALLFGWLATRRARRRPRLVAAIHTTINRSAKEELQDRLVYRFLLKACDNVIFVCHNQRNYWISKYPFLEQNSLVIFNGVDTDHFRREPFAAAGIEIRERLGIAGDTAVITSIAGFRPEKGHRYLLEAFSGLPTQTRLLLAGDGPTRPEMEKYARELGLDDRVHFLGNLSDVRPLLAASQISVLASTAVETFSIAMLESMSMRVPVVATDIGGLSEAIRTGVNGSLVPPASVKELESALKQILSDREGLNQMGLEARQTVAERFTLEAMTSQTVDVLAPAE